MVAATDIDAWDFVLEEAREWACPKPGVRLGTHARGPFMILVISRTSLSFALAR